MVRSYQFRCRPPGSVEVGGPSLIKPEPRRNAYRIKPPKRSAIGECPLPGVKQTSRFKSAMSAPDPMRHGRELAFATRDRFGNRGRLRPVESRACQFDNAASEPESSVAVRTGSPCIYLAPARNYSYEGGTPDASLMPFEYKHHELQETTPLNTTYVLLICSRYFGGQSVVRSWIVPSC